MTKYTPFYLIYGRNLVLPLEINNKESPEDDEVNLEENLAELILQRTYELEELLPQHQQIIKELEVIDQIIIEMNIINTLENVQDNEIIHKP